ncbi:MAG TPA: serine/threonine-protein kinase [Gemmatales bacterium]|nr:serine/threonine-protein kinase [Gemmatales bacterium]
MPALSDFLQDLEHTRLLTPEEMTHYREATNLDPPVTAEELASELVRHGKLSRYQAETLLLGKCKGLMMGNLELLAPLGKGGMAHVFLATDRTTHELLAVKLLPPNKAEKVPHMVDRFHREALVGKRLDHPGITKVLFLKYIKGVLCLGLEYVPGIDVYRHVRQHGVMQTGPAARFIADLAIALDHAHRHGIVHADLKPANVMLMPREVRKNAQGTRCKILDFGLAIDLARPPERASLSGKGNIAGTLAYMAPEQTSPDMLPTPASDIYSLGATLFYALTGRPPFHFEPGTHLREKLHQLRNKPAPEILDFVPTVPKEVAEYLNRLLAKDPAQRPKTAQQVAQYMRELARGRLTEQRTLEQPR